MIPILDLRLFSLGKDPAGFTADMARACRGSGVFLLSDHGVPRGLLKDVFEVADAFFALPALDKSALDIRHSTTNRGWAGFGVEVPVDHPDRPFYKESFSIGLDMQPDDPRVLAGEPFRAPNIWPALDMFRDVVLDYYKEMLGLGRVLMRAVERDMGLHAGFFQSHFTEPMATLRLSHYPADPWGLGPLETRGGPAQHDYGALTLVLTDGSAGLQLQDREGTMGRCAGCAGHIDCHGRGLPNALVQRSIPLRAAPDFTAVGTAQIGGLLSGSQSRQYDCPASRHGFTALHLHPGG